MHHANPVVYTLEDLLGLNRDPNRTGALAMVRVLLNDGSSLFGCITQFSRDAIEFQQGVSICIPDTEFGMMLFPSNTMIGRSDLTFVGQIQQLRFGKEPENIHHVVCSAWMRGVIGAAS